MRTGTVDGTGAPLVPGWDDPAAAVDVTSSTFTGGGVTNLPVIRVVASVPFQPVMPGLMNFAGLEDITIESAHEQAYLGS